MTLSAELLLPIAEDNPAGADLRYDPVYDRIKDARREDQVVATGDDDPWKTKNPKVADWPLTIKLATEALGKKTKDLQIAAWLAEALLRRDGFGGFREGLDLIVGLLDSFWEGLYPELEDGDAEMRVAPLGWLSLKLDVAVKSVPITAAGYSYLDYLDSRQIPDEAEAKDDWGGDKQKIRDQASEQGRVLPEVFDAAVAAANKEWYRGLVADIGACQAALSTLSDRGDDLFSDVAPSYRSLQAAIEEVERTARQFLAEKLEADPDPVELAPPDALVAEVLVGGAGEVESGAGGPSAAAGVRSGEAGAGGISAAPTSVDDAAGRIAVAARYLRRQIPTSPAPYMMVRGFRWGELRAGGGQLDPRLLVAPPTEVRVRLKTLLLDARWAELLEAAEEVMAAPHGRGWLDLQRIALTACENLGLEYEGVAAGIRASLRTLLEALPELPSVTLMDDSPTANAETLRWLSAEGMLNGEAEAAPATSGGGLSAAGRERDPRARARDIARNGSPSKAIEYLMREAAQAQSERARFLRRVEATGIMVDEGLDAVALPILRELAEQVDRLNLAEWESGGLVAEPLGLLYRSLGRAGEEPSRQEELYLRICRLDPIYAMKLNEAAATREPAGDSGEGP